MFSIRALRVGQFSRSVTCRPLGKAQCLSTKTTLRQRFASNVGIGNAIAQSKNDSKQISQGDSSSQRASSLRKYSSQGRSTGVEISLDGSKHTFSPILLRDLDESPRSVDASTKQKLFLTTDIPSSISASSISQDEAGVTIQWNDGIPQGDGAVDSTFIRWSTLRLLVATGQPDIPTVNLEWPSIPNRALWTEKEYSSTNQDMSYDAYMHDDSALLTALHRLQTHGLLFLTGVPESEDSVAAITQRVGPVKNTFYGYTWDVRSVPEAKNVAYTSQDLGFHMDLLYMKQPPHLQFLHCIRSSAAGGASLFTDAFKSAQDLYRDAPSAFVDLAALDVNFHYNHPTSHLYRQARKVFELGNVIIGGQQKTTEQVLDHIQQNASEIAGVDRLLEAVSWSPPFQGPFDLRWSNDVDSRAGFDMLKALNDRVERWHAAASKFNSLIHRPEMIYERMMGPGECVIFDNRRVLHARRAFEVGDAGKERWLRGSYLDKDPYLSRMNVLQHCIGRK